MTSWVGTSMVIVRRLTRTIRSIGQNTQIKPGPFGSAISRPIRKMTPRSYSRRTFSEMKNQIKTITTAISTNGNWSMVALSERAPKHSRCVRIDRFDFDFFSRELLQQSADRFRALMHQQGLSGGRRG